MKLHRSILASTALFFGILTVSTHSDELRQVVAVVTTAQIQGAIGTGSTAQTNLGFGTAALASTGTSGSAIPLLSGNNVWGGSVNRFPSVSIGSTAIAAASGEFGLTKITTSAAAPGAGTGKLELVAGTNSGTCKLIIFAGTSTTPVTVVDNVGAGC